MAALFRILVATDGSAPARAALKTALAFPWPEPSRARGVVALGGRSTRRIGVRAAAVRALYAQTEPTKRLLARRWPDAWVVALHERPADAIFSEARRFGAQAIAVGWRGHGALRRLLAGSVSRELTARSRIPVLIARRALPRVRRIVIGFDGSAGARRALRFAARLEPRRGSRAVLVNIVGPDALPAIGAERRTRAAAVLLERAGWPATVHVRAGAPLQALLDATAERKGSVLVLGARATSGLKRIVLGSVAAGALDRARVPVLIVP